MHGFPLWSGYGNFHPPPSFHTPLEEIAFPTYGTSVQEFIFWTLNQASSKPLTPPPNPDLLPLALFTMIGAQWILMCEYINTRLGQIEYEIELGLSNLYAQDFDQTVKTLLIWRRRIPIYHSFVERTISRLSARYSPTAPESTTPLNSWSSILVNFKDIFHRLEILHCRADKIMTVSMAVTAREESKKATQESHAITKISYLAFFFLPLNFWTSFFSMGDIFPVRTYWIYAIMASISACAIAALMFAGTIGRRWTRFSKGRKGWICGKEERVSGGV
jgi:Mg2+ and Co2+ transporter CorA